MGERFGSQSLKSPTSDTDAACGATKTNWKAAGPLWSSRVQGCVMRSVPSTAAVASRDHSGQTRGFARGASATSRMTRASSPGSIVTGRRSCRITRSTTSSSRSNMLRLSEVLLQLLAGALHSHLQRRYPGAGQLGDLLVLEILDVLEQKRLAVLGCEAGQGSVDGVRPLHAVGLVRMRGTVQRVGVLHEHPAAPRRTRACGAAAVHQDAIQPCAKPRRIVAARQRPVRAHEAVLQRLFGVFMITDHVNGVAPQAIAIARNQCAVSADVAGPDPAHQLCVAWLHFVYTHRLSRRVTR